MDADGQITVASALDHENRDSYNLTTTVSDPAGGSDSMNITITVTNVEEAGSAAFDSTATAGGQHPAHRRSNRPGTGTSAARAGPGAGEPQAKDRGPSSNEQPERPTRPKRRT